MVKGKKLDKAALRIRAEETITKDEVITEVFDDIFDVPPSKQTQITCSSIRKRKRMEILRLNLVHKRY